MCSPKLTPTLAAALLEGASQLCHKQADGTFGCLTCGRMFSNQSNCKRHIRTEHLGEDKHATCPNCTKQVLRTDIKRHMKKHCANRDFATDTTQFGF
jgi:DNA-directed RNA polymerase subunit RPC12/RpoP